MKLVGITRPTFFKGEADAITLLLEGGLDLLHIRKPGSLSENIASLLSDIPPHLYSQIVIHDHFDLIESFPLKGIHLNKRNPVCPSIHTGSVSRSCHSMRRTRSYRRYRLLLPQSYIRQYFQKRILICFF